MSEPVATVPAPAKTLDAAEPPCVPRPDPLTPLAGWYLRPRFGVVTLLPLLAGLTMCLLLALLRGAGQDPHANLRESTSAMLAQEPPDVPAAENAAADYGKVGALYSSYLTFDPNPQNYPIRLLSKDGRLFENPKIVAYLQANASAISMLKLIAQKPHYKFKLNYLMGWAVPLPHLGQIREYGRCLAIDARAKAHGGDHAGAAADIEALYKIAGHPATDPFLICGLVQAAVEQNAYDSIQAIMLWDTPAQQAELEAYRRSFPEKRDWRERCLRFLRAERAIGLYSIDMIAIKGGGPRWRTPTFLDNPHLYSAFCYASDRRRFARILDDWIASTENGRPLRDVLEFEKDEPFNGPAVMTQEMLPSTRAFETFIKNELRARAIDAGLAVLLFRLKHHRDPTALSELVPEFLESVPEHPLTHEPLILSEKKNPPDPFSELKEALEQFRGERVRTIPAPARTESAGWEFILPPLNSSAIKRK